MGLQESSIYSPMMWLLLVFTIIELISTASIVDPPQQSVNCPMQGMDCAFNDIEQARWSDAWQECAAQCARHKTCAYWSWHVPDALINPRGSGLSLVAVSSSRTLSSSRDSTPAPA